MTKEELLKYKGMKKVAEQLKENIEMLKEKKTSIKSQIISDMPVGSGKHLDTETLMIMIEDTIEDYVKQEKCLIDAMQEIEEAINTLSEPIEQYILRARYIECKNWEEICVLTNYSWRQIHRLHSNILKKIA